MHLNNGFIPAYTRNDFTDKLHDSFGFRTDYEILSKASMRNIISQSKKGKHYYILHPKPSARFPLYFNGLRTLALLLTVKLGIISCHKKQQRDRQKPRLTYDKMKSLIRIPTVLARPGNGTQESSP